MLKHSIRFRLQPSKDKSAAKPRVVKCIINYNNTQIEFGSGLKIEPQYWNQKKQEPRQNILFKDIGKFKTDLKNVSDWANKAFEFIKDKSNEYPDTVILKELCETLIITKGEIPGVKKSDATTDFIAYAGVIIDGIKNGSRTKKDGKQFAKDTPRAYGTTKAALNDFVKDQKLPGLTFNDINLEFYVDFKDWCYKKKYFTDNYFGKHIKTIKNFMNDGLDMGLHKNLSFKHRKFIAHKAEVDNVYLDEAKLQIIADWTFKEDETRLTKVRDMFLVGCWTGLRFSDFSNIQPKNIQGDFIEIKTKKTGETVAIPIHPTIKAIMKRYEGVTHNSLPPAISNAKFNEYIKDAAAKTKQLSELISLEKSRAGKRVTITQPLHELISTHTARRSFATNMFKMGVPSQVIMAITGHRSEKTFGLYLKTTPREKAEMMKEIWNRQTMKAVQENV